MHLSAPALEEGKHACQLNPDLHLVALLPGATQSPPGLAKDAIGFFFSVFRGGKGDQISTPSFLFSNLFSNFVNSCKPFHWGKKMTSTIPNHSSPARTNFHHCKLFQEVQTQLSPFHAIPVRTKPTSSIPSHSSYAETDLFRSKPF
jgi:hypothetical protein